MKKLFCILCVAILLEACTATQRPSLYQIQKNAIATIKELQEKEYKKTLTAGEQTALNELRNLDKNEEIKTLLKYIEREINYADILTMATASEFGYSAEEIEKFLGLGLYVKNPYCENEYKSYEVFQVLSDFVLASGCEVKTYDECDTISSKTFIHPKQNNELYFDKKILTPPNGFCSTYVGVYKYESKNGMPHTVPILTFLPKTISKQQLENVQKAREELSK